jgi:SAM-dependent methyltransferase
MGMTDDLSEGWEAAAEPFIAARSPIGAALVRSWAQANLPRGAAIVDIGCGSGVPIAEALLTEGFALFAIDAAPTLLAAFRRRFPDVPTACEAAQHSAFFHRRFDAAIAIGLLFLLSAEDQARLIARIATALEPGGRFLFSAPREPCEWPDLLTGRLSRSLGEDIYARLLQGAGLRLLGSQVDEGGNHYFDGSRHKPPQLGPRRGVTNPPAPAKGSQHDPDHARDRRRARPVARGI